MSTQQRANWRPWLVFAGCCVLSFVGFGFIVNTMGLYYTPLCDELGISRTQIALAASIMAIAAMPTTLLAGNIMKRIDSRVLISVCVVVCSLLFLAQSFFTQLWQFYISFALMGVAYVIPITLAPSVLLVNWFEDKLGLAMGIALGVSGIGGMVFNPVVSSWITNFGWRTSYRVTALVLAICILPFAMFAFKFHPDQDKGECAYGHTVNADAAKTEQDGELPGLSLKQAAKTRSFALLVILAVLLQPDFGTRVSGRFRNHARCGRRQGDYRHPARPCENRGGHRLVCVTWTVRLGSHGDYQCASGSHGCRLPCGYRPGSGVGIPSLDDPSVLWAEGLPHDSKRYLRRRRHCISSRQHHPRDGVRYCWFVYAVAHLQCRLLHGSCCLRNSCVQTAPDEGGQEQFRTITQTQGAKQ